MNLRAIFKKAILAAENYDGSEASHDTLMTSTIAYDEQSKGQKPDEVDNILATALSAFENAGSEENFIVLLERGGAKIFHHNAVFIRPDPEEGAQIPQDGEEEFEIRHEPRLKQVVMALQGKGIYFDDLVIDMGAVRNNQMRKYPYNIITIPRLNAQIAVADQYGEALLWQNRLSNL